MAEQPVALPPITVPIYDRQTGLVTTEWYRFMEDFWRRTGGDVDKVEGVQQETITLDEVKADGQNEITAGLGLEGGGFIGGDIEISAKQDTGWTAATGAGDKGAYAQYAGQTISGTYNAVEAQVTDDAVKAVSARLVAVEAALRANESIDG